ncbi:MAG TPA: sulfatase-like hydrolase/transferase [Bryobacteraceae bacterium]|nr:sulfatase-like hydrolase/transferase [Bryobacteraceae bacterium]
MRTALVGVCLALLPAPIPLHPAMAQRNNSKPEHAVILIIDGLSYKALQRLEMKNLRALAAAGTYYERSYNILPADPREGEWTQYHSSSIPNPVILAGTVMLRTDQRYVQESFYPDRITAHAANDTAYRRINVGFHLSYLNGSDERPVHDDQTMYWALDFLRHDRPAFMKVHLQDTGNGGYVCYQEKDPAVPWRQNIWAEGSPYVKAALQADAYLGQFLRELESLGLRDKTLLFVTADHGQADAGWHPFDAEEAWSMPLVVAGPGVRAGQRFEYAEQIDIVPTLCHLMGVKPPANASGRILAEALENPPKSAPRRSQTMKELDALLRDGDAQIAKLRKEAETSAEAKARLAEVQRDFYGLDRILRWHRFGTVAQLMAHDRKVLDRIAPR